MKTFFHWNGPGHDQLRYFHNWEQFNDDPRTKDLDLHIGGGGGIDFGKLRSEKININMYGEWPNDFFGGKKPGMNANRCTEIEEHFDYVLNFDKSTAHARGHIFSPYGFDHDHICSQVSWDNIDDVKKDTDVFMIGNCEMNESWRGEVDAIFYFYQVVKKFSHFFCNSMKSVVSWDKTMDQCSRSKISVVWVDFFHATKAGRDYAKENYDWLKWKNAIIKTAGDDVLSKQTVPQMKGRVYHAAFCKSIILCYKSPYVGDEEPYNSPIEDYLDPDTDFIYFEDCDDLERKIKEILEDYDNPKYKTMVDSAYNKMKNNHDIKAIYEKYIVPLAKKGKKE